MKTRSFLRLPLALLTVGISSWTASCAVSLGPGYTIEKQEIRVRFVAQPEPRIEVTADYYLKNTGTRSLEELEMRLPGRQRFHYESPSASWDSTPVKLDASSGSARDTRIVLPQAWDIRARHTLRLSVEYSTPTVGETTLGFSNEAFFLPAAGWSPELLPPKGIFATGGVPPKKWDLFVAVPDGFHVHTSGVQKKSARKSGETAVLAAQGKKDPHPFVIAGRYQAVDIGKGSEKVHLWTRKQQDSAKLKGVSEALARIIGAFDASFGERRKESSQTWIVECPIAADCFTNLNPLRTSLLGEDENERPTSEMISQDTVVLDLREGTPGLVAAAAPSLAASWLGYAQNPAFFEQSPPLTMLPAFAAAVGLDAAEGGDSRAETIRRALKLIPPGEKPKKEEELRVLRVKSFLLFYALRDRYGNEAFRKAIQHVLYARRERGFDLSDFVAAFEEETHQNVAEFVRMWMKRPGVPEEFRARYEGATTATGSSTKERKP